MAEGALPIIKVFTEGLERLTAWLRDLPKPVKAVIGTFGVLATGVSAVMGPLLVQIAALSWFGVNLPQIVTTVTILKAAMLGFASSIWAVIGPLLPLIAIIGAIVGAILLLQDVLVKGWEKSYLGRFVNWLLEKHSFLKPIAEAVGNAINWLKQSFESLTSSISRAISWIQQSINRLGPLKYALLGPAGAILFLAQNFDKVTSAIRNFINWIQNAWKALTENPLFKAIQGLLNLTPAGIGLKATTTMITKHRLPSLTDIMPKPAQMISTVQSRVEHKTIHVPKIEIHIREGKKEEIEKAMKDIFGKWFASYGIH